MQVKETRILASKFYDLICIGSFVVNTFALYMLPGAVAGSEACPLGMQVAQSLIPTSGTFFNGDLVMKKFLRPFSLFPLIQEEQLSVTGERMCTKYW